MKKHLAAIEQAVRDRLESNASYIIWKSVEDRNVADVNDVVGLFHGTYQEADALI